MRTFLDSGVLMTAWKGKEPEMRAAMQIMDDTRRTFVTSELVKLELLPKPAFFTMRKETKFYAEHFAKAVQTELLSHELCRSAFLIAEKHGLAAVDALHVAAAIKLGAEEFITTESPGKPLFRVNEIKIIPLHAA